MRINLIESHENAWKLEKKWWVECDDHARAMITTYGGSIYRVWIAALDVDGNAVTLGSAFDMARSKILENKDVFSTST